jgi:hypothetical protein
MPGFPMLHSAISEQCMLNCDMPIMSFRIFNAKIIKSNVRYSFVYYFFYIKLIIENIVRKERTTLNESEEESSSLSYRSHISSNV